MKKKYFLEQVNELMQAASMALEKDAFQEAKKQNAINLACRIRMQYPVLKSESIGPIQLRKLEIAHKLALQIGESWDEKKILVFLKQYYQAKKK